MLYIAFVCIFCRFFCSHTIKIIFQKKNCRCSGKDHPMLPCIAGLGAYFPRPMKYRQALFCTAAIHE